VTALRQIVLLALLGFAVVTLSGPLVAVASVVLSLALGILSFALVGFLIVALIRAAHRGQRAAWEGACQVCQNLAGAGQRFLQILFSLVAYPFRIGARSIGALLRLGWVVFWKTLSGVRVLGEVTLMTLTGVLVGVLMGFLTGAPNRDLELTIFGNALAGGVIALVAGVVLLLREKRAAAGRTA
jgi:hypothetical protein